MPTVAPSEAPSQEEESSDSLAFLELPAASLLVDLPLDSDSVDFLVDSQAPVDSDLQVPEDSISLVDFKV